MTRRSDSDTQKNNAPLTLEKNHEMAFYLYVYILPMASGIAAAELTSEQILGLNGQYTYDILKNNDVRSLVRATLCSGFVADTPSATCDAVMSDFNNGVATNSPSTLLSERYLVPS